MSDENKQISFSSASVFPAKLLRLKVVDKKNRIMPIHIQLNPTNVCNFHCPFCSCENRDRTQQMSLDNMKRIMKKARMCGCKSVTITGGGEPLMHPQINELIEYLAKIGIKVGIVGNGARIANLNPETFKHISWFRISASDFLEENLKREGETLLLWFSRIKQAVGIAPNVDWAFSYVLTKEANYELLAEIVDFANTNNFTHVRIVSDLLDLENVPGMDIVKHMLQDAFNIDDSKVIYQDRQVFTKGTKRCLISLLKPVITPDGKIVACCGWQYRGETPSRDYDIKDNMGDAKDIEEIFKKQKFFDGSQCSKCYYSEYNWSLDVITSKIKHEEWV